MAYLRPATAAPTRGFPKRDDGVFGYLHTDQSPYASMATIEAERPWSRPEQTWTNYSEMRGSTHNLLRVENSATRELTTPYHLTSTNPTHAAISGMSLFTRKGRGAASYERPRVQSASLTRSASSKASLPLEHSFESLARSPSLRSLRLERRQQHRPFGRPTPIWTPPKTNLNDKSLARPAAWADPMVAGIGYAEKFLYRD